MISQTKGWFRGGILLLETDAALRLVEVARVADAPVLGVDSFKLTEHTMQPASKHTLDLSAEDQLSGGGWKEASQFIEAKRDVGIHFEVVLAQ